VAPITNKFYIGEAPSDAAVVSAIGSFHKTQNKTIFMSVSA
jgi:hypothetical protein